MSLKIEAFPRMRLLFSEMNYVTWKKFPRKIELKKVARTKKCNARLCCAPKSATKISSKIYNLKQLFAYEHKMHKTSFKKCKNIARIFRNKAMSLFFTGAPSSRLFCRKSNEMHEFSLASTFSAIHVTRCICFLFSVCIVWISVVVVVVAVFSLLYCHFPSLIILLSTQCLFAAAFCRTTVSHWTKWNRFMCIFFGSKV